VPSLVAIRDVYARRGLRGVLRGGARWLRRRVSRGRAAAEAETASPIEVRSDVPLSPATVDLATARAWFESRRATYEMLVDAVAAHLPPDGVVLDVGANIGYFTLVLTERAGFRGRAHLFEPVPNLAELCARTVAGLPCQATVHRIGLSDTDAHVEIFVSSDGNLGWNTIVAEKAGKGMTAVEIEVARYDGLGLTEVPDLVKIDVEGAEYRVLAGMMTSIARWTPRPLILCEIGWGNGHPAWEQVLAVLDELTALGFEAMRVGGGRVDVRELRRTTDVLFVPTGPA
jgi:FkbM family methyltransferase